VWSATVFLLVMIRGDKACDGDRNVPMNEDTEVVGFLRGVHGGRHVEGILAGLGITVEGAVFVYPSGVHKSSERRSMTRDARGPKSNSYATRTLVMSRKVANLSGYDV